MSDVTTLYGRAFEDNILLGAQQLISKFREKCVVKTGVNGKSKAFGWIDSVDAREKTVRHADTIYDDPGHNRATAYLSYHYKSLILDPDDEVKVIADPKSAYVKATLTSLRREMDDKLISAINGSKYTGEAGTTSSSLGSDHKVAIDGTKNLKLAQLIETLQKFNDNDVDEQEEKYIAISPGHLSSLLQEEKLTSKDYMTLQALVPGKVVSVLGFNFMISTRLPGTTTDRKALAWAKSGLGLAIGTDIKARVDEVQSKHYAFSTYASMMIGATRIEDEKVVEISANESNMS